MKLHLLNHFVFAQVNCISENLELYKKEKKQEQLHQLRLSIKRTRAVLSFLRQEHKGNYIPKTGPLKSLFKKAGAIRKIHLNILLLGKLIPAQKAITEKFRNDEKKVSDQFCNKTEQYLNLVSLFKDSLQLPEKVHGKKAIKRYVDRLIKKARHIVQHEKSKKKMHALRILMKKLMYVYDVIPGKTKNCCLLNVAFIKKLEKKAGDWHDTYTAICFFKHIKSFSRLQLTNLYKKEKKQFNALVRHLHTFKTDIYFS